MQAAGVNPALAMGQGGASTPTGSNAQGSASLSSPMDVISMAMQMKMMQTEISLKKSQERLNDAKADEAGANTGLLLNLTALITHLDSGLVIKISGTIIKAYPGITLNNGLENSLLLGTHLRYLGINLFHSLAGLLIT